MKFKSSDGEIYEIETCQELLALAIKIFMQEPKDTVITIKQIEKGSLRDEHKHLC